MNCTHPDHNEHETCEDRAVGCSKDCICCMGDPNADPVPEPPLPAPFFTTSGGPQLVVNVPPIVKSVGHIQVGNASVDATFDLTGIDPRYHYTIVQCILRSRIRILVYQNTGKSDALPAVVPRPWWKFWA